MKRINQNMKRINQNKVLENYNWTPDPRWDNKILSYDTVEHNWADWFLESVRELKPTLPKLEDIHLYFATSELINLRKHLEKLTNSAEFSKRLDNFFEQYISPLVDGQYLIQSTCGIRVVVPNQEPLGRLLSFHTGYWTGYSNSMGTVWTPLTKAYDSNSMQVVSWEDSVKLMYRIHNSKLCLEEIQNLCIEKSFPVNLEVGNSWLFNQGHLHGNINNSTNITRVSFDARYALTGGDFGPRRAGSFFRSKGQFGSLNKSNINQGKWVIFIDQNSDYIGETPHYMIREFLLQYASNLSIRPTEWSNEYWSCTWMPKFHDFVASDKLKGIVMPSIHAFSCTKELKYQYLSLAVKNNIQIIFADENLLLKDFDDLEKLKMYDES